MASRQWPVLGSTVGLLVLTLLACGRAMALQPLPIGGALRLAAAALLVSWSHLLALVFRRMRCREISPGYCVVLFFGGWSMFFLVYTCLL